MKTIIITFILGALFSISNIYANEPEPKVLTNVETTESGTKKEIIYLDEDSSLPKDKTIMYYNTDDQMLSKCCYKWDGYKKWIGTRKYEYKYNAEGKIESVTHTEWDDNKGDWADKSETTAHVYTNQGELMATN
ncbi:MAG: DUF3836 domain-containing protein [Prevotella sp.]|jgi:hypothetical protein|nr:DUF3836 domain-containing protein [Prevotella sp.]